MANSTNQYQPNGGITGSAGGRTEVVKAISGHRGQRIDASETVKTELPDVTVTAEPAGRRMITRQTAALAIGALSLGLAVLSQMD